MFAASMADILFALRVMIIQLRFERLLNIGHPMDASIQNFIKVILHPLVLGYARAISRRTIHQRNDIW
jgi:hypothetical protein